MPSDSQLSAHVIDSLPESIALFLAIFLVGLVLCDYIVWLIDCTRRLMSHDRRSRGRR
ncbi:MAG: hypothetical protein ACPH9S_06540 [Candidatus Puniceispirillaceae bacterium]